MKWRLAKIREQAVVLCMKAYPGTNLEDMGLAVGFAPKSAKSMVSGILKRAGFAPRPRGMSAPSFNPELRKKLQGGIKRFDREPIEKLLRAKDPIISQQEIADTVGCHLCTIVHIAKELNLPRGKGGNHGARVPARHTDAEILECFNSHPGISRIELAGALGYSPKSGCFKDRVRALGINFKLGRRPEATGLKAA